MPNNQAFPFPLYLVSDETTQGEELAYLLRQALEGGVSIVQIRHKGTAQSSDIRTFIERAQTAKDVIDQFNQETVERNPRATQVPLIINDRVDVALAVDADGVHLGQSDMPVTLAKRLLSPNQLGKKKIIGLTVESPEQLQQAQSLDIDYLGISTVFNTATKQDTKHEWGLSGLAAAVKISEKPLVAIGGIDYENIGQVAKTGVASIALVSAICAAKDPKQTSEQLKAKMSFGEKIQL
ncbi:MAG: thiamine phosphate synthase [Vibrio sp.]